MSARNWTPEQLDAITARGGSVLVSAAAGSGKTSVLVERVIRLLTDSDNPIDADRLLVVTFTKAAAAEMKDRILAALEKLREENPNDALINRQILLLPNAEICTIHSFCSRLIKDNSFALNIMRDFRIGTENELSVLQYETLDDVLEELYKEKDEDFSALSNALVTPKSDYILKKTVLDIFKIILSHPYPKKWLEDTEKMYDGSIAFEETPWGKSALKYLKYATEYADGVLANIIEIIEDKCLGDEKMQKTLSKSHEVFFQFSLLIKELESAKGWNGISDALCEYEIPSYRKPSKKNDEDFSQLASRLKSGYDEMKNIISALKNLFTKNNEECMEEVKQTAPLVKGLSMLLTRLYDEFTRAKEDKGIIDFSDLEHLAIKLLLKEENGTLVKTQQAKDISQKYYEIIIDEYQDTNKTQDMIFNAISKDETNLFVVGDVKQCIYRFREAMPEIFLERRDRYTDYDRDNPKFPARIFLSGNFRSREGIIDCSNYVFSQIMSQRVGEVEYNENEMLKACAKYEQSGGIGQEAELCVIENNTGENDNVLEARHIAKIIEETVGKRNVTEAGVQRKAKYSDICILMRSPSTRINTYVSELQDVGIPVAADSGGDLFLCNEVKLLLSVLNVIDNPLQDIPLTAMMMSAVYGFTPDDMAIIRTRCSCRRIYSSVAAFAAVSDKSEQNKILIKRCAEFIDEVRLLRKLSSTMSADRLIEAYFAKSGFLSVIGAMKNGGIRIKNVRKILDLAREYEKNGFRGLSGFLHMLDKLKENEKELKASSQKNENAVKIMSIHSSKGLEFPICILADLSTPFKSDSDEILYHPQLGFGFKNVDTENFTKSDTIVRNIISIEKHREKMSEEMRILYVALTRAKEKLYFLTTFTSSKSSTLGDKISECAMKVSGENISPYSVENCSSLTQWIVMSGLRNTHMGKLRSLAGCGYIITVPTKSKWDFDYIRSDDCAEAEDTKTEELETSTVIMTEGADDSICKTIEQHLNFKYKYAELTALPTKVSASHISHEEISERFVATDRPNFDESRTLSAAQRGTALHEFFHYADIFSDSFSFDDEIKHICKMGFLTKEQCDSIDEQSVNRFLSSTLFKRMKNSERLVREYRFTVNIPASFVDENLSAQSKNEPVLMQGAIDCCFVENGEAVIVDYKTDRVKDISILAELYTKQLELYKLALEQTEGIRVRECIIYSLRLSDSIRVL